MLFIDSDIGFNPQDVIAMMALQTPESPYDVMAGPYPKKCITWEKIKQAVDAGVADEDPNRLEDFVGDFVFNPAVDENDPSTKSIRLDEPAQVLETGTGFMMIRRSTFDKYKAAYPQYSYKPDHIRTEAFDGSREIHATSIVSSIPRQSVICQKITCSVRMSVTWVARYGCVPGCTCNIQVPMCLLANCLLWPPSAHLLLLMPDLLARTQSRSKTLNRSIRKHPTKIYLKTLKRYKGNFLL
jgi:hypothetical protein